MSGLSDDQLDEQERCIEKQRVFLDKLFEFMEWAPRMERRIIEAEKNVDEHNRKLAAVDKRLTDDITDLRKIVEDRFGAVMELNKNQSATLEDHGKKLDKLDKIEKAIEKITPILEYTTPLADKWDAWRPKLIWVGLASTGWVIISFVNPTLSPATLSKLITKIVAALI